MKHFGLGLLLGAATGFTFAFLKDENGKSAREYLRDEIKDIKKDQTDLKDGVNRAQESVKNLSEELPKVDTAIKDLDKDVNQFKREADREISHLQEKIDRLNNDLNGNLMESEN